MWKGSPGRPSSLPQRKQKVRARTCVAPSGRTFPRISSLGTTTGLACASSTSAKRRPPSAKSFSSTAGRHEKSPTVPAIGILISKTCLGLKFDHFRRRARLRCHSTVPRTLFAVSPREVSSGGSGGGCGPGTVFVILRPLPLRTLRPLQSVSPSGKGMPRGISAPDVAGDHGVGVADVRDSRSDGGCGGTSGGS